MRPTDHPAVGVRRTAWAQLAHDRLARTAGLVALCLFLACLVGPLALRAAGGPDAITEDVLLGPTAPSAAHWLGTDVLGRDLLVRTLVGGRIALLIALAATFVSMVIGLGWGAVAGWRSGWIDELMMRVVDLLYALPILVILIVTMALLDTRSPVLLVLLLGGVSWLTMARIVRAHVLSLRHRPWVEAELGLGIHPLRVLVRHVIPSVLGPAIAYATLAIPGVMLSEAFLTFLGLGVAPPSASLGTLVAEGTQLLLLYPWTLVAPAALMALLVVSLGLLGDGLRDALDPREEGRR